MTDRTRRLVATLILALVLLVALPAHLTSDAPNGATFLLFALTVAFVLLATGGAEESQK